MTSTPIEKSFCTTREAAMQLGVSVGTIQLWVESGLLQAWKTAGGHRRILRNSIEDLLHKRPESTKASVKPIKPIVGARRIRVMVVDADVQLLRLYQTQISRWPLAAELTLIDNAMTALMQIGRGAPDLLITDLHMPGMDGFALPDLLSKAPEMANTTVVVVTSLNVDELRARGDIRPGVEVLSKPIPFARLLLLAQDVSRRTGSTSSRIKAELTCA